MAETMNSRTLTTTLATALLGFALLATIPTATAHASSCLVEDFVCTCSAHTHVNPYPTPNEDVRCSGAWNSDCDNSYGVTSDTMIGTNCDQDDVAELLQEIQ
jgi:hypothetical protein